MSKPSNILAAETRRAAEEAFYTHDYRDMLAIPALYIGRVIAHELPPMIRGIEHGISTAKYIGQTILSRFHEPS